jgi:hypothetical protein
MNTGSLGTFVISWSQTETDGLKAASMDVLTTGASWRWSGAAVRVDGPQGVLILSGAEGAADIRRRAAQMVRRLVGAAVNIEVAKKVDAPQDPVDESFVVTDGHRSFALTIIPVPDTGARLIMAVGNLPPVDQDLWVVRTSIDRTHAAAGARAAGGVICFTPDTQITTPFGRRRIDALRPGDMVMTRDNGPQEVIWTAARSMTGARLYAMPHLRPIRIRADAFGLGRPDQELLVSPQHRMLLRGRQAQALFGTNEVLVEAEHLLNDRSIVVDHTQREVTYVHLMLERHNVIWANGLETESFHPSNTELDTVDPVQREVLLGMMPEIRDNPHAYGDYARRNLSRSEAAILRYEMAS